jgi:MFS family permease
VATVFQRFLFARVTSSLGASLTRVAVPLAIYDSTQSSALTAAATVIMLGPLLVFGIPAGAVADRHSRLRVMRIMEGISAGVLLILMTALLISGVIPSAVLVIVACLSTAAVFFDACSFGFVPRLVGKDHLSRANSYLYGGNTVVSLIGPAAGGFLYAVGGLALVVALNVLTYIVSLLFLLAIPKAERSRTVSQKAGESLAASMKAGVQVIIRSQILRFLVMLGTSNAFAGGALLAALVIICRERFAADGASVGLVMTIMGAGAFLGSVALGRISNAVPQSRITLACPPLGLLFFVSAILAPNFVAFCISAFLWELIYAALIINNVTLRQSLLPDSLQSRVNSTARTIAWGGEPLGAALVASLLTIAPYSVALWVSIVPLALVSVLSIWSPLRKRDVSEFAVAEQKFAIEVKASAQD